jgi:hypothetical protein
MIPPRFRCTLVWCGADSSWSCAPACGLFPDLSGLSDAGREDVSVVDAGLDATANVTAEDVAPEAAPPCPDGAGPTMVNVGPFCIDSTEVTANQCNASSFAADSTATRAGPTNR